MIARLQDFYGGSPDGWLRIPLGLLRILSEHLPRLEAERMLGLYSVVLAGSGGMKRSDLNAWLAGLRRQVGQRAVRAGERELEALPIKVVRDG